jgi:Zn-dependent alcohol dehydrogenase
MSSFGLGGFAAQALIHEDQLVNIPVEMPFLQAALLGCGVVTGAESSSPDSEITLPRPASWTTKGRP